MLWLLPWVTLDSGLIILQTWLPTENRSPRSNKVYAVAPLTIYGGFRGKIISGTISCPGACRGNSIGRLTGHGQLPLEEEVAGLGAWLTLAAFWTVVAAQPRAGLSV